MMNRATAAGGVAGGSPWREAGLVRVGGDGLRLHVARAGDGPPLLMLHGFTGSAETWAPFVATLGARHSIVAPDLTGHARSDAPADAARYAMGPCVRDLVALLDALGIGRCSVLGYSMGGRVALSLALAAPERVSALVLESASPGIADPAERAARAMADAALADDIERDGVATFAERWARLPMWASQERMTEEARERLRAQRLSHAARGLANSLRGAGQGSAPAVHDHLSALRVPTLLVAGALDAKYERIAREMRQCIPYAELRIIEDAGHAVHIEAPAELARVVGEFLE
ncbi:MAG TPA: 2-succinyl-6-hydroxy-2,4-cyclohexadiene-1-carboxylate synthase [Gemmatimonadales bacterium]